MVSASSRLCTRLHSSGRHAAKSPGPHRWTRGNILELPSNACEHDFPTKAFRFVRHRRRHSPADAHKDHLSNVASSSPDQSLPSGGGLVKTGKEAKYLSTALVQHPPVAGSFYQDPGVDSCRVPRLQETRPRTRDGADARSLPKHELLGARIYESPTAVSVLGDTVIRLPPNCWIVLDTLSQSNMACFRMREVSESTSSEFVSGPKMYDVVGGGYISEEEAATLKPVAEHRLSIMAAEANFKRASQGASVLALRHAAHALELVVQRAVLEEQPHLSPEQALSGMAWSSMQLDEVGFRTSIDPAELSFVSVRGEIYRRLQRAEGLVAWRASRKSRRPGSKAAKSLSTEPTLPPVVSPANRTAAKGVDALRQFLEFCNRRFGNLLRAWFALDPEENMRLGEKLFVRRCLDLGFSGNVQALYRYVDNDENGTISFAELDSTSAMLLAGFKSFVCLHFEGSTELAFQYMDTTRSGRVRKHQFVVMMKEFGYRGPASRLFDLLDRQGFGYIHERELKYLTSWRPQPYLLSTPNFLAMEAVKECFADVHGSLFMAWRKALDVDCTMRLTWEEFCVACKELKKRTDHREPIISQAAQDDHSEVSTDGDSLPAIKVAGPSLSTLKHMASFPRPPRRSKTDNADQAPLQLARANSFSSGGGSPCSPWQRALDDSPRSPWRRMVDVSQVAMKNADALVEDDVHSRGSTVEIELPSTEQELASVWRALDIECSGAITLKDFDPAGYEAIAAFKRWVDRVHGGAKAAMRQLDGNGNGKLAKHEMRKILQEDDEFTGDVDALFAAWASDGHRCICLTANDLVFMDHWDLRWEEFRDEARKAMFDPSTVKRWSMTCGSSGHRNVNPQ